MAKKARRIFWLSTAHACLVIWIRTALQRIGVPAQATSFNVSDVTSSSFTINCSPVPNTTHYEVVLSERYSDSSRDKTYCVNSSGTTICGFTSDILYDSTFKTVIGNAASASNRSEILHSLPGPPTLQFSTPKPRSVIVIVESTSIGRVTQWTVEYRMASSLSSTASVSSTSEQAFSLVLLNLTPFTTYEIRGAATQVDNSTNISASAAQWSVWYNITTDALSVFGRVTLTNVIFTTDHTVEGSSARNDVLEVLQSAYSSTSYIGIFIISIEDSNGIEAEGNAIVHYRLKVEDKSLPSPNNYKLNGTSFIDAEINNGGLPLGTGYALLPNENNIRLLYVSDSNCSKIVERFLDVTVEGKSTNAIHLNVASSSATTPEESDGLQLRIADSCSQELIRDDEISVETVLPNKVIALTPRILVKDCLRDQATELCSELDTVNVPASVSRTHFYWQSEITSSVFQISGITYTSLVDESVSLKVPAVERAVTYEILNGSDNGVIATTLELDGSETWTINIGGLVPGKYVLKSKVSFRTQNGSIVQAESENYTVQADQNLCSSCSDFASCDANVLSGDVRCTCLPGYVGDGLDCTKRIETCECQEDFNGGEKICTIGGSQYHIDNCS